MDDKDHPARKRRPLTALARVQRRSRIFARLREGAAYDEIAEEERLSTERVRQIVREALAQRLPDEDADHAKLQLARLRPAMKIATDAIEGGDVGAIPSFLKVLDRLDRYQKTAKVNQVYDDDARKKLFEKLNRVAANLGLAVIENPAKAKEQAAPEPAPAPQLAAPEPPEKDKEKEKEKTPWGVGGTS